ncbi:MAG: DUF2339 domain-containing protein [Chthoniobacterales bacterium]
MDTITGFVVLGLMAFLVLPVALHLWHLRAMRQMRASLQVLARRVTALEPTARSSDLPPPLPVEPMVVAKAAAIPAAPPPLPQAVASTPLRPSLENAIGVKLFAWMGGLALFVGVLLAVRYAFENNLITPEMRVVGGAIVGLGLVAGGLFAAARRFRAPAFSMCATGVLVLYGDIYAAFAYYDLLPLWLATVLMSLVSVGAFLLAIRLDAQVIVVLGMLGGFLTPALLWMTAARAPLPLFGYAALLNTGVAAVALRKRWDALLVLAALATIATEFVWLGDSFNPATASSARLVFLFFGLQFLLICFARQRLEPADNWSAIAAALALNAGLVAAFSFVESPETRVHGANFIFPFVFACNVGVIALALGRQLARGGILRDWFAAGALALAWVVEWSWQDEYFAPAMASVPLLWYLAIAALFVAYPYFSGLTVTWPWTIAAVAGALQFSLVYRVWHAGTFLQIAPGLLPLAFAVPFALGAWFLVRRRGVPLGSSDNRLASQAGAALMFLSLIFPVQFRAEWITVGWAMEGVALLLLYRVLPNARLPLTAVLVLCAAFARLAFNPAVLEYHRRSAVPIWNWYLYAYGITGLCLLAAGWLLRQGGVRPWMRNAGKLLYTLAVVNAFLLLNIEIADYFSVGPTLTFSFSGNFARDMSYSIAWAFFAFALLLVGMRQQTRAVRYAALALLLVTLAKLFLHDFANLGPLYRIGAFLGVAVILILASFVYQRFLAPAAEKSAPVL